MSREKVHTQEGIAIKGEVLVGEARKISKPRIIIKPEGTRLKELF
jgi:hypothetical protein